MAKKSEAVCRRRLLEQVNVYSTLLQGQMATPENVALIGHLVSVRAILRDQEAIIIKRVPYHRRGDTGGPYPLKKKR